MLAADSRRADCLASAVSIATPLVSQKICARRESSRLWASTSSTQTLRASATLAVYSASNCPRSVVLYLSKDSTICPANSGLIPAFSSSS